MRTHLSSKFWIPTARRKQYQILSITLQEILLLWSLFYLFVPVTMFQLGNLDHKTSSLRQQLDTNRCNFWESLHYSNHFSTPRRLIYFLKPNTLSYRKDWIEKPYTSVFWTPRFYSIWFIWPQFEFPKRQILSLLQPALQGGLSKAKAGLVWRHFMFLQVYCTSYLHLTSTKTDKYAVPWAYGWFLLSSQKKLSKMKDCSDAGPTLSTFFKSLTPAPEAQQFDWSKSFLTTFLFSKKYVF